MFGIFRSFLRAVLFFRKKVFFNAIYWQFSKSWNIPIILYVDNKINNFRPTSTELEVMLMFRYWDQLNMKFIKFKNTKQKSCSCWVVFTWHNPTRDFADFFKGNPELEARRQVPYNPKDDDCDIEMLDKFSSDITFISSNICKFVTV